MHVVGEIVRRSGVAASDWLPRIRFHRPQESVAAQMPCATGIEKFGSVRGWVKKDCWVDRSFNEASRLVLGRVPA